VGSRREADVIAIMLGKEDTFVQKNIRTMTVNGDRSQAERNRVTREFNEGKIKVVICTNVFERGMDITGLDYVSSIH
jgi:superfamily II DNA/RNA helicase